MADPPQAPTFTIPDSLGDNPFPRGDSRRAEWETWSIDVLASLSLLCDSLQELKAVGDAQAYHPWRMRHIELAPPEEYDPLWVDRMVLGDQTRWIVQRVYGMFAVAFEKFVREPEDLEFANSIVTRLADLLSGVLRTFPGSRGFGVRFRKAWTFSKPRLKRFLKARTTVARESVGNDEPDENTIERSGLGRYEQMFLNDANFAKDPPRFFRPIEAKRLLALAALRQEAETIIKRELPKTKDGVISCLHPAVGIYAVALFDAMAESELGRLGPQAKVRAFARWLESKCLPAVVEDVSGHLFSQFPVTIGHLTGHFGERHSPETWRALLGAWVEWNPFSEGSVRRQVTKSITTSLDARRAHWEGLSLESAAVRGGVAKTVAVSARRLPKGNGGGRPTELLDIDWKKVESLHVGIGKRTFCADCDISEATYDRARETGKATKKSLTAFKKYAKRFKAMNIKVNHFFRETS